MTVPVRNSRQKWRIVLVILFALLYPILASKLLGFGGGNTPLVNYVILAASTLPPAMCLWLLPYKRVYIGIAFLIYLMLAFAMVTDMHSFTCCAQPA